MSSGSCDERRPWKWTKRRPAAPPGRVKRTPSGPADAERAAFGAAGRRACAAAGGRSIASSLGTIAVQGRVISPLVSARARHVGLLARPRDETPSVTAANSSAPTAMPARGAPAMSHGRLASGAVTAERRQPRGGAPAAARRDGAGRTRMRASARAISVTGVVRPAFSPNRKFSRYWSILR